MYRGTVPLNNNNKPLTRDITVICPLADSYVAAAARKPGPAAEEASTHKTAKYSKTPRALPPVTTTCCRPWRKLDINSFRAALLLYIINTKNCSLSIVLTATDQKPQKSLKSDITHHHIA